MSSHFHRASTFFAVVVIAFSHAVSPAADLHVSNRWGNDAFNGRSDRPAGSDNGPVRTVQRAIDLARRGDRIVIDAAGAPYYEMLSLTGLRHSGFAGAELTIIGNGATISGARPVPTESWTYRKSDLWSFTPFRKGTYLLLRDGKPVPEVPVPAAATAMPELPEGHWCAWRGAIHYRSTPTGDPREESFAFAAGGVGLSLYGVRHVVVRDLTFEHFRQDGVHAHDLCRDVSLVKVVSRENGRAGVAVGGSAEVRLIECTVGGNRRHDVLIEELGRATIEDSRIEKEPTVAD